MRKKYKPLTVSFLNMFNVGAEHSSNCLELKEAVRKIQIIDTHEHLVQEKKRLSKKPDLFEIFFSQYASSDLVSSGMSQEDLVTIQNPNIPLEKRFRIFKPYWDRIQNTGYARAINIAIRDLYGISKIDEDTYKLLASRMIESNKPGLYKWVLRDKAGIEISILDKLDNLDDTPLNEIDRDLFAPVKKFDIFIDVSSKSDIENLANACGKPIHSFSDIIQILENEFKKYLGKIVGIKTGLAYVRPLHFEKVSEKEAEEVFNNIISQEISKKLSFEEVKPYQDFVFHKVVQLAGENKLPILVHTGIQAGNDNVITNSNPTLLINIFREYKEVKFDLFHGAYPYVGELSAIAKTFQNVYIDMCWLHIISPYMARKALSEWLDSVPANKIFGFGGDYVFVEGVYGHSVIARENIARVLTEKVEEGFFSEQEAINLAKALLRDNAREFFFGNREYL